MTGCSAFQNHILLKMNPRPIHTIYSSVLRNSEKIIQAERKNNEHTLENNVAFFAVERNL
jgi:hypothetical protein